MTNEWDPRVREALKTLQDSLQQQHQSWRHQINSLEQAVAAGQQQINLLSRENGQLKQQLDELHKATENDTLVALLERVHYAVGELLHETTAFRKALNADTE